MKKIIATFCICLMLVCFSECNTLSAYAASPIDSNRESSLSLQYKHGGKCFEGLEINIYRIAEVFEDGTYDLCDSFNDYPVNIYGITSQAEWDQITSTLSAYAVADHIEPTCKASTDKFGWVEYRDILPGIYLTLSVNVEDDAGIIVFDSFLTAVPQLSEDGNHNYDVVASPKCELYIPGSEETEYKVVKQWKDNGDTEKRPEYIEVDITKNGIIEFTVRLSANNNWSYIWHAPDDGSKWQAVERNIPEGYTVTVIEDGTTIIISNGFDSDEYVDSSKTGDTTVLWPYVLAMCMSGIIIIVFAVWNKRTEQ